MTPVEGDLAELCLLGCNKAQKMVQGESVQQQANEEGIARKPGAGAFANEVSCAACFFG